MRREHSRAELARKLLAHAESPEALDALLQDLEAKGQLSDARYAQERARVLSRKYGPLRIRHDLRDKSVDEALIDRVVAPDEEAGARAVLARRYRQPASTLEERAKRVRFLLGRGFSAEVAYRLLRGAEEESS